MYGRYGIDQLYYASLVLSIILMTVNMAVRSSILSAVMLAVLTVMIFRISSRNTYKRRLENETFLKLWNPIAASFSLTIRRIKEFRTHRFRTCPQCRKTLRLPLKKGTLAVTCPHCRTRFKVRIRW